MSTKQSVLEILDNNSSLEDLRALASSEFLSAEDERYLQVHILITISIKEMPKERVPESLLNNLYSLEQSAPQAFVRTVVRETKQSLPYVTALVLGFLLYNSNLFTDRIVVVNVVFLSAAFGFLFYTIFKSKFFIV